MNKSALLKDLIICEDIHPKLTDAIIKMISSYYLPYYGEFCQFVNFHEAKIKTCGVNCNQRGMNFYWGRKFVEKCSIEELIFTIVHEVFHLLLDHQKRAVGYDKKIANLAADMIINSLIHSDLIIQEKLHKYIKIPSDEFGNHYVVFLPKEYDGEPIFEDVYRWLLKCYYDWKDKNSHKINKISISMDDINKNELIEAKTINSIINGYGAHGKSGKKGEENSVEMYPLENFFESCESENGQSFDIHFEDDVPEEVKRQWVEGVMHKLKLRGSCSADVEAILGKLRKKEKDYLKEIKRKLSNNIFGAHKQKTITKLNRRGIWGLKGNLKKKDKINCILDTSGSMSGEFEKALSYVFQNDLEINLIQCDAEVKSFQVIKKKSELEKIQIRGLGGTSLTPGLQYIASHKELNKYNNLILTDGYVDDLNFSGVKGNVLILSTGVRCPVIENSKKITQILIEKCG